MQSCLARNDLEQEKGTERITVERSKAERQWGEKDFDQKLENSSLDGKITSPRQQIDGGRKSGRKRRTILAAGSISQSRPATLRHILEAGIGVTEQKRGSKRQSVIDFLLAQPDRIIPDGRHSAVR